MLKAGVAKNQVSDLKHGGHANSFYVSNELQASDNNGKIYGVLIFSHMDLYRGQHNNTNVIISINRTQCLK